MKERVVYEITYDLDGEPQRFVMETSPEDFRILMATVVLAGEAGYEAAKNDEKTEIARQEGSDDIVGFKAADLKIIKMRAQYVPIDEIEEE